MKTFSELNYYELLQIAFNASSFEIRQAYKNILEIYGEDSLATYSLFSEDERREILSRVEKAFLTLIDNERRQQYDKSLIAGGEMPETALAERQKKRAIPIFQMDRSKTRSTSRARLEKKKEETAVRELISALSSAQCVSGPDLKKLRTALGVELEEVFQMTKIGPTILQAIEEDDFAKLPPGIYLRGFLASYAEVLQVEAKKLIDGYLKNMGADKDND